MFAKVISQGDDIYLRLIYEEMFDSPLVLQTTF